MALLCYGLLAAGWLVDLFTPQLFIAAILYNGPIALSSLALRSRLTINLVFAGEAANAVAAYVNGLQAGHEWNPIALGNRLLAAASFVLVGYLSVKAQGHALEAGAASGRERQIEIEKALREATGRMRGTLNVELVQRAIVRESVGLLGASRALLIVRDAFEAPLTLRYDKGDRDVSYERRALGAELGSLVARACENDGIVSPSDEDALGRLTLSALNAQQALAIAVRNGESIECVLVEIVSGGARFAPDALPALRAFAEQAAIALEQARLFAQLGAQNDEIARQKNELADRAGVIRDIVYALAHDLRTPIAAAELTMKQALGGAYGALPDRYRTILRTALGANADERRIVETLLLVARYEAGEESTVRERVACSELVSRVVAELQAVAEAKCIRLREALPQAELLLRGDPHELRRALANLLANAIDASPNGGSITVRVDRDGNRIRLAVEDEGNGVPAERRPALFARFGGIRAGGGTGLGLYIVRRIAQKHGGDASYAPRDPRGSIFTIFLPAAEE